MAGFEEIEMAATAMAAEVNIVHPNSTELKPAIAEVAAVEPEAIGSLNKIPPELRLSIYAYALTPENIRSELQKGHEPAILDTCRLVRKEALEFYEASLPEVERAEADAVEKANRKAVQANEMYGRMMRRFDPGFIAPASWVVRRKKSEDAERELERAEKRYWWVKDIRRSVKREVQRQMGTYGKATKKYDEV